MSTQKKPAKPNMEDAQAALQALINQGKKEGMIRATDLNAILEKLALTPEKIEEIYDRIDAMNIQLVTAELELDLGAVARLMQAGVPVALSGSCGNSLNAREDLLWNSAEMMKVLHDSEAVLKMVTSIPAAILGIDQLTGSLRPGLRADLVIWSGNPMQTYQAHIVRTYLGGQVIYQEGDEMKCM